MEDNPTGGDKNIELSEITQVEDEEAEGTGQEETNFDELERLERLRDPNASIVVPQGYNTDVEADKRYVNSNKRRTFLGST